MTTFKEIAFELFTEVKEIQIVWIAIYHGIQGECIAEHSDCLTAIIKTGYSNDRETARLMAMNFGYAFDVK